MKSEILKIERQIWFAKRVFEQELSKQLNLHRISSPIAILDGTGINDDLNDVERTVKFPVRALDESTAVIVNSLAKWKRIKLKQLEIDSGGGIVTDMRAIRPDDDLDHYHSIYVDQWDWEKTISVQDRCISFLKSEVEKIYRALQNTEAKIHEEFGIEPTLPKVIKFMHSEELLQMYPDITPKERETKITQQYGAVFLMGVGGKLSNGEPHDLRAPDYDDWTSQNEEGYKGLNGDILVWNSVAKEGIELSSMGIRVDKKALLHQLDCLDKRHRLELKFHQMLVNEQIPLSIGGGIGQSRVCMFLLRKKHIGEVQVGIWPDKLENELSKGDTLLL